MKLLLPIDGSDISLRAVDHVIAKMQWYKDGVELHLINVQPPLPGGAQASALAGAGQVENYHKEEGMKELRPAQQKLDASGIKYQCHIAVGDPATVIADYAKQHAVGQIVMGTRGRGVVARALMGSVATKVLENSAIPVVLVK